VMAWRLCLAALASCLLAASPPVEILSGVVANEVIQQDGAGTGTITLRARCAADQCLGVEASDSPEWTAVQLAQLDTETQVSNVALASAVDPQLLDEIHADIGSLKRIGGRLANLACADLYPARCEGVQRGPRPVAARMEGGAGDRIAVMFSSVNGKLVSPGRVNGFSLRGPDGADLFAVNDAVLDAERPDTVVVRIKPHSISKSGVTLWYGWGNNPYCNLQDGKDMAAPVFSLPVRSE
jgi:hypothetical protein